eukprot:NODE_122_length_17689_cov_1.046219.p2 type:complete len:469 gc:universal NODE_122_length_17689_cov_1.046219:15928-17334(+)
MSTPCSIIQTTLSAVGYYLQPDVNCCTNSNFRLTCDSNSQITELNWSNMNLFGSLPSNLATISTLIKADFNGNKGLTNFDSFSTSTSLTWLDISNTNSQLTKIPNSLTTLYMQSNGVTSFLSSTYCPVQLKVLDISDNQITSIPCAWPLTALYAQNNKLTSTANTAVSTIKYLDLSFNKLTTISNAPLNALELAYRGNNLNDLGSICQASGMVYLDVGKNSISTIPECLNTNLLGLAVDHNVISDLNTNTTFLCTHQKVSFINLDNNMLNRYPQCMNHLTDIAIIGNLMTITSDGIASTVTKKGFTRFVDIPETYDTNSTVFSKTTSKYANNANIPTTAHSDVATDAPVTTQPNLYTTDDQDVIILTRNVGDEPVSTSSISPFGVGNVQELLFNKSAGDPSALLGIALICFMVVTAVGFLVTYLIPRLKSNVPFLYGIAAHIGLILGELHSFSSFNFGVALFEMGNLF